MICALTHDDPVNDCAEGNLAAAVAVVAGLAVVALGAVLWLRRRRRG
jgi:LPXTG-motif cell wall-anchored protein